MTKALGGKPADAPRRGARGVAKAAGLSPTAAVRAWRAFGRRPRLRETFKPPAGRHLVGEARGAVGLCLRPPGRAAAPCAGERPGARAPGRTQPAPGQAERGTRDHARHGIASLFAALDVATGRVIGTRQRRLRQQSVRLQADTDAAVPREEGVTAPPVVDDSATHKAPAVRRWLQERPRPAVRLTPTGASWLNQAGRLFAGITERRIRRGVFKTVKALEAAIGAHLAGHNAAPKPFKWTATADLIPRRGEDLWKRTCNSGR